jgi:hypothetical protein
MPLIVEDGSGLANAQAYCSVAYLDAYLAERGLEHGHSTHAKEAALVISAKDWLDGQHAFKYEQLTTTQALQFPRTELGFPEAIKLANAKAAHLHLHNSLLVDTTAISVAGVVESESKGLGPLSKSVTYKSGSAQIYGRILPADLTNLLRPYLSASGMMRTVHRA